MSTKDITSLHGIPVPVEIMGIERRAIVDNEVDNPGLGYTIAYQSGRITVTLYIYDFGVTDLPDGVKSPELNDHFSQCVDDAEKGSANRNEPYELLGTYAVGSNEFVDFYCAKFSGSTQQGPTLSSIYLSAKNGYFVKLRISCPNLSEDAGGLMDDIGSAYAHLLWPR